MSALLGKLGYLVAGAPFPTATVSCAHVVLPTALWLESEGTCFGVHREPAIEPPGGALSYGEILRRLVARMGAALPEKEPEQPPVAVKIGPDLVREVIRESRGEFTSPSVRSTAVRYAAGALTDWASYSRKTEVTV